MTLLRHIGIRLKITLAFSAVFALLSFCLNLYCYDQIRELIIRDNNNYLLERAKSLLAKTEVNPVIIPLPDKNVALKIYARASTGERTLVFQSPGIITRIERPRYLGVTDTLNMRVAYVAGSSEENPAELLMAVSNAQVQETLHYLLFLLVLSTLVSVIVSALVSYWLARFFLTPVQNIINTAKNINSGQLRETVPVPQSNDELQDLAETLNKMLARIDRSLQQQQNFFASASHELKTPLAILRTGLEMNVKNEQREDIKAFFKSQLEEVIRLQDVVQEFLVISQIREGQLKIQPEKFDLSGMAMHVFNQLRPLAGLKQINLKLQFDRETDGFSVTGDKEKLKIVLLNLVENAIKYAPDASAVTCSIKGDPGKNVMEIVMTNATEQESVDTSLIGQAFYRGEVWQPGSGIGLWLCSEILSAHQGSLRFESRHHQFRVIIAVPLQIPEARGR